MSTVTRLILLLSLLLSAAAAQKQSTGAKPASLADYKLVALKVTGTARYTDKEILAASGLQIGQNAADGDFKEAVQRLGNSGLFSSVVYSYSSSSAGTRLELQLVDTDNSKLVPAQFDNFVWFTDDELRAVLQRRVPLFKQVLPLTGNLADRVSEALQAILSEKNLPGRVNYLREGEGESGGPLVAIAYRVEEVSIRIRNFEFPGASPDQTALLTAAAHRAIGANYERSSLAAVAKFDLLPVYLQRGYLKAAFGPSDARAVPQEVPQEVQQPSSAADAQSPADLQVDAIQPVTPGKMYLTSGVDWKGNSAIAITEVAPLVHMPLGRPADAVRLLRDIENVGKLYRSRGYMAVQIKPDAHLDDEKSTVHYELNIVEGDLYKMGELEILGLDTQAKARMQTAWTLRAGQPYNADYPQKFLYDTRDLVPRGVQWNVSVHETPDAKEKTVDVEIRFKQQ
ncbi:MAG TPA: POTRA domain-containing protein [Terriglobales bacterium]|jgi:outer membrane protein assembly factor BamA|nr:POTRA domain-containing protein [Terriglobales bacterium]